MFLIHGKQHSQKKISDYSLQCLSCKAFDQEIIVNFKYYHLYYIPFLAYGKKEVTIRCKKCGALTERDDIKDEFKKKTKVPLYLYTGAALIAAFITWAVITSTIHNNKEEAFISDPKVGDVYLVQNPGVGKRYFYFMKVYDIVNDTVCIYLNNSTYSRYASGMISQDYFNREEAFGFSKAEIKQMHAKGEIVRIFRNYDTSAGFDREQ